MDFVVEGLNWKYQQTMIDRAKSDKPSDILRCELQALKLIGQFHDIVSDRLCRIVDEYHRGHAIGLGDGKFDIGPLRIMFITDYANAEEEVVAAAYSWLRQELIACRWIAGKRGNTLFLQPLMTVVEYKGFRALGILNLPLSSVQTMVMNTETGMLDELVQSKLKDLASAMNLVNSFPHRSADGRILQVVLSPSLEVHKIEGVNGRTLRTSKENTTKTPSGLYITNVHDIVPVYPADPASENLQKTPLYFRPEFIESIPAPITPGDTQGEDHQNVLKLLKDSRLPAVLALLASLKVIPLDSEDWRRLLHEHGLNMALLGAIAEESKIPHVKEGAIIEMVARTVKGILRGRLRSAILHFREVQALRVEEELAAIVLDALNGLLLGEQSWIEEIISAIEDRYGYCLDEDVMKHLPRNALLVALAHHCCIRLKDTSYSKTAGRLDTSDFAGFRVKLANGGNGPFFPSHMALSCDAMAEFANAVMPCGTALWQMEGRRAAAARTLVKLADGKIAIAQWDEAIKLAELANGLCPKYHPVQISIQLLICTIKTKGPANMTWHQPVLGEKPLANSGLEELKRCKTGLLNKIDKHFGHHHHPLGIITRVKIAELMEFLNVDTIIAKEAALTLRSDALGMAYKILGRRHPYSISILADNADALNRANKLDEAIAANMEVLKVLDPNSETFRKEQRRTLMSLMTCWKGKGDYEVALHWAGECRKLLEDGRGTEHHTSEEAQEEGVALERVLEEIAELSIRLYAVDMSIEEKEQNDFASALKTLLVEEIIADPIAKQLQTAIECYTLLFDARRTRHDLGTSDGEALLRLVCKIILLTLRLATPCQRPLIKTACRKKMFIRSMSTGRETMVRELLVRMVTGTVGPAEIVERVLAKAQSVDTLGEAEVELSLLLDLIEHVH